MPCKTIISLIWMGPIIITVNISYHTLMDASNAFFYVQLTSGKRQVIEEALMVHNTQM
jgi:hypothetical protein